MLNELHFVIQYSLLLVYSARWQVNGLVAVERL